jgi:prepilin-type N-terminal cleavage/methylation domain-containing protein
MNGMRKTIRAKATEGRRSSFRLHPSVLVRRRGFSFTEVLFAVIILGIGFIMVAAIFPAAIQQGKLTNDETNAAAIARGAFNAIDQLPNSSSLFVGTSATSGVGTVSVGRVYSFRNPQPSSFSPKQLPSPGDPFPRPQDELWSAIGGNYLLQSDPRFAWIGLYRRDGDYDRGTGKTVNGSGYAQVFVVPVQVQNRSQFDRSDYYASPAPASPALYNLQARPVTIKVWDKYQGLETDMIGFDTSGSGSSPEKQDVAAVAEGAYVIVSDDNLAAPNTGALNGNIYRVGNRRSEFDNTADFPNHDVWELQPGNDYSPTGGLPQHVDSAAAFVIGRSYNANTGTFEGAAQDISIYTTFIQLK